MQLITLVSRHDWNDGLLITEAVRRISTRSSEVLRRAGYIEQVAKVVGYEWRLTGNGIKWLVRNQMLQFTCAATQYNIWVKDASNSQTMLRHNIEHFDNCDDEWVQALNFTELLQWLELTDGFDYKTGDMAYIFNPAKFFDNRAVKGIDYIIIYKDES